MTTRNLDHLLRPQSLVLIADQVEPSAYAQLVEHNLNSGGFKGELMRISASPGSRLKLGPSVRLGKMAQVADLALICTRPELIPAIIRRLGEQGTRAVIIGTVLHERFSPKEAARLRQAILDAACPYLMRILGPGSAGVLVPAIGLNASLSTTPVLPGKIALISQSTSIASAIVDYATSKGIGFSTVLHLGESADIDLADLLDWLSEDPSTARILVQFNHISQARKFMSAARASARNKPVIAIRNRLPDDPAQRQLPFSPDEVYDAALRRAGWVQVDRLGDAFEAVQAMARLKPISGQRLTIMTNGYGLGALAADELHNSGARLANLEKATLEQLAKVLQTKQPLANPLELPPSINAAGWAEALELVLADANTTALMTVYSPSPFAASSEVAQVLGDAAKSARQNIFSCWVGGDSMREAQQIAEANGVLSHDSPEQGISVFMGQVHQYRNRKLLMQMPPSLPEGYATDLKSARSVIHEAVEAGSSLLPARLTRKLLHAFSIEAAEYSSAASAAAAVEAANQLGYPVDLSLSSAPDISASHLHSPADIHMAIRGLRQQARQQHPGLRISGYRLRPSVPRSGIAPLRLGVASDPLFGPLLYVGPAASDQRTSRVVVGLPPLNLMLAQDMLRRSGLAAELSDELRNALHEHAGAALVRLSQLLSDVPEVVAIELDPLHVETSGVLALQAKVTIAQRSWRYRKPRFAISPYPKEQEREFSWQGDKLLIRPIRPEDEHLLGELLSSLTPEDARLRFFTATRGQTRAQLARFCQIDYDREMSLVVFRSQADGSTQALGEARLIADADNQQAELSIVIRSALQGQGLGRLLMQHGIDYARAQGIARLHSETLAENRRMQHLAQICGFSLEKSDDPRTISLIMVLRDSDETSAG